MLVCIYLNASICTVYRTPVYTRFAGSLGLSPSCVKNVRKLYESTIVHIVCKLAYAHLPICKPSCSYDRMCDCVFVYQDAGSDAPVLKAWVFLCMYASAGALIPICIHRCSYTHMLAWVLLCEYVGMDTPVSACRLGCLFTRMQAWMLLYIYQNSRIPITLCKSRCS